MYQPRTITSDPAWSDPDGVKIYTVSVSGRPVDQTRYFARLAEVKRAKPVAWPSTAGFALFHDGASAEYLVLAWWGNDNELFTSVSVRTPKGWVEDPTRFSFCVWALEIVLERARLLPGVRLSNGAGFGSLSRVVFPKLMSRPVAKTQRKGFPAAVTSPSPPPN